MTGRAYLLKFLLSLSAAYFVLVAASIAALFMVPVFPTFMDGETLERGCFLTEALLAGAACHGFWGSEIVAVLLNLPFYLLSWPIFGIGILLSIGETGIKGAGMGVLILIGGVALWAPIVYLYRATQSTGPSDLAERE